MVNEPHGSAWFEFRIEETEGLGVEAGKLSKLLQDMSSAFYAIARTKLGREANRPGRHMVDEDALAAIRILRLSPGSAVIEAEPPAIAPLDQAGLALPDDNRVTAEDVLIEFALEARRIGRRDRTAPAGSEVRRRVQTVLKDAREIGRVSEVVVRPRSDRSLPIDLQDNEFRVRVDAAATLEEHTADTPALPRRRRLSGHAYMVDVEPGRYRIRLKLPDGRDLTLEADAALANALRSAVDRVVEIEAVEELTGDQIASRTVVDLAVLPSAGPGSDKPPKTIEELAEEQGLSGASPDYENLASLVWQDREQASEFAAYLQQVRQTAST